MENHDTVVVLDVETTGLDHLREKIIEFAAVKLVNGEITEQYETLINPEQEIRYSSFQIHGISQEMVADAPTIDVVMPKILEFIGDYPIVGHNVIFDYNFLNRASRTLYDKKVVNHRIDTQHMFREVFPEEFSHGLEALMIRLNVEYSTRHRAMADTIGLAQAFPRLQELYNQKFAWQMVQLENVEYLFERYLRIQQAVQIMQAELLDIKSIFKLYFEKGGRDIVSSTGELLTYGSKTNYSYNLSQIKGALEEAGAFERAVKLNNGLVDRMIMSSNIDEDIKERLSVARIKVSETKSVNIVKPERNFAELSR